MLQTIKFIDKTKNKKKFFNVTFVCHSNRKEYVNRIYGNEFKLQARIS